MPYPSALTNTQLTNMRADYNGRAYVLATPTKVVFQAQLSTTYALKRATVVYTNVTVGAYTAIRDGMTIIIHESANNLSDYVWRGRVRGGANATNIDINESDTVFLISYYITVLADYDTFPRLAVWRANQLYVDYDLAFQRLPLAISGLQSVYAVNTTATTTSIIFAPTVTSLEAGVSVTGYLWDVGDGTITSGTSTSKDVTVSFPAGNDKHRWVSFTATNNQSVSHTMRFEVYSGNFVTANWSIKDIDNIQFSADWTTASASITVHGSAAGLIPNNRVAIVFRDMFGTSSAIINTNVAFVGRLTDDNVTNSGEDYVQQTVFNVASLTSQLANMPMPKFAVFDKANPSQWNDLVGPTPISTVWHVLTRYSTFGTLVSYDALADYSVYVAGEIEIEAQGALDACARILERICAVIGQSPSGELRLRQTAHYLSSSDKNTLTTVAAITTRDMLDFEINKAHNPQVGYVEGGGMIYFTANSTYQFGITKSPTIANTAGEEIRQLNNQILDNTSLNAGLTELGERTGAFLALSQNRYTCNATLFDAWRVIVPSNYDWYTFAIATSDNNRGYVFDVNTRWLLMRMSVSADVQNGSIALSAEFEQEADPFGYGSETAVIPAIAPLPLVPQLPLLPPYDNLTADNSDDGGGAADSGGNWLPTDDPTPEEENPLPPDPHGDRNAPSPRQGCGVYQLNFMGNMVNTRFNTVNGAEYLVELYGSSPRFGVDICSGASANIPTTGEFAIYPTLDSRLILRDGAFVAYTNSINAPSNWFIVEGTDGVTTRFWEFDDGAVHCFTNVDFIYRKSAGGTGGSPIPLNVYLDGVLILTENLASANAAEFTKTITFPANTVGQRLKFIVDRVAYPFTKLVAYRAIFMTVSDATSTTSGLIDAFYDVDTDGVPTVLPSGRGLAFGGVKPFAPPYNGANRYSTSFIGTGSPVSIQYQDTDYSDNTFNLLNLEICGQGAS